MTRDPRADELLREALERINALNEAWFLEMAAGDDRWQGDPVFDKIHAYLAEPQPEPEPEWVWRVTFADGYPPSLYKVPSRGEAEWIAAKGQDLEPCEFTIERAPIGPWEVVSDD